MMNIIKANTEKLIPMEKIDERERKLINEYMSKYVSIFERGVQKYESAIDEYGCSEYGDGEGFEEEKTWYTDNTHKSYKFDE